MKNILNRFINEMVIIYPDFHDLGSATLLSLSEDYFTVKYPSKIRYIPYSSVAFLDEEKSIDGRPILGIYVYYKGYKLAESSSYF